MHIRCENHGRVAPLSHPPTRTSIQQVPSKSGQADSVSTHISMPQYQSFCMWGPHPSTLCLVQLRTLWGTLEKIRDGTSLSTSRPLSYNIKKLRQEKSLAQSLAATPHLLPGRHFLLRPPKHCCSSGLRPQPTYTWVTSCPWSPRSWPLPAGCLHRCSQMAQVQVTCWPKPTPAYMSPLDQGYHLPCLLTQATDPSFILNSFPSHQKMMTKPATKSATSVLKSLPHYPLLPHPTRTGYPHHSPVAYSGLRLLQLLRTAARKSFPEGSSDASSLAQDLSRAPCSPGTEAKFLAGI